MGYKNELAYFNEVKARFAAQPGTIVFISAISKNVDDLVAQTYTTNDLSEYNSLLADHWSNGRSYFVIGRLDEDDYTFFYACKEFLRRESYATGELLESDLEPFKPVELNAHLLTKDFANLQRILSRNSQAS